jgi:hypothetical protein
MIRIIFWAFPWGEPACLRLLETNTHIGNPSTFFNLLIDSNISSL